MISSLGCCVLDNQQVFFCSETILFQLWCDLHLCILGNFYRINSHWNPSVSGHSKTFAFAVQISRKKFQEFYQQLEHYSLLLLQWPPWVSLLISGGNIFCRYLGGLFFLMYRLPFLESILFGALISATDPVSVLAVFQVLNSLALYSMKHLIILRREFQKSFDNHNWKNAI
jgi:hypothetical protein